MKANLDDLAAKLPQVEFKRKKKKDTEYRQRMQSLRGGRQFLLFTSTAFPNGTVRLRLLEITDGETVIVARRYALFNDAESIHKALKSLEEKAGCKLYYVLLISTDGEYL